jgi:hypothetical protein
MGFQSSTIQYFSSGAQTLKGVGKVIIDDRARGSPFTHARGISTDFVLRCSGIGEVKQSTHECSCKITTIVCAH